MNIFLRIFGSFSKKERIIFIGALIICILAGIAKSSLFIYEHTGLVPAYGGTFREGMVGQPVFINPVIPITEIDRDISRLVFSSLSDLAESITYTEGGRVWNVRLKDNILWHDGERLTSDDVIFTIDTIQDPESRSPLYASFLGVAAERISEREVQFVLQNPYAFFSDDHLRTLQIIPRHIFDGVPVQNFKIIIDGQRPIGSGPYTVKDHAIDENKHTITSLTLEAYDNYFGNEPYIPEITLKFYKTQEDLVTAYNAGEIDGFGMNAADNLAAITMRRDLHFFKSPRYYAIFINQGLAPDALSSLETRKALSASIDRPRIIREVFEGHSTPLFGPSLANRHPAFEDADLSLLSGLSLHIAVPSESFLEKTAAIIKENWEAQGANVAIDTYSLKDIQENILKNNNYDMVLFGNVVKESQDLFSFWHSSRRFYPDQNLSLYENSAVDSLLEEYRTTFDTETRKADLEEIGAKIAGDVPAIFLYSPDYVYVASPNVQGLDTVKMINTASDRFADISSWYVRTKRVFTRTDIAVTEEKTAPSAAPEPEDYLKELEKAMTDGSMTGTAPKLQQ